MCSSEARTVRYLMSFMLAINAHPRSFFAECRVPGKLRVKLFKLLPDQSLLNNQHVAR
jgi:hypothetical protein